MGSRQRRVAPSCSFWPSGPRPAMNALRLGSATVPVACSRRLAGCAGDSGVLGETPKTAGEDAQCH